MKSEAEIQKEKRSAKNTDRSQNRKLIAKKDFVICQNEYFREIKTGEDVSDVPERFHINLRTEGVL